MIEEPQTHIPEANASNIQTDSIAAKKKFSLAKFWLILFSAAILAVIICEALGWPFFKRTCRTLRQ